MKFTISFLLIAIFSYVACIYFPWWSIAVVAFIVAILIPQKPGRTFLAAFFSLLVLWTALSFWLSHNNDNLLAHKISLVMLRLDSPYVLMLLTGLIGGIVAGFAALAGSFVRTKPK